MIKRFAVDTFVDQLHCDECDVEMKYLGIQLTSNPPKYPHECPKCGATQRAEQRYPATAYRYKEVTDG